MLGIKAAHEIQKSPCCENKECVFSLVCRCMLLQFEVAHLFELGFDFENLYLAKLAQTIWLNNKHVIHA